MHHGAAYDNGFFMGSEAVPHARCGMQEQLLQQGGMLQWVVTLHESLVRFQVRSRNATGARSPIGGFGDGEIGSTAGPVA